jgi:hypothetical protein
VTTEGRGISWEKAVEMNIPVVRPEWVEGCERGGRIVGVRGYYLDADPRQRQVVQAEVPQQTSPEPVRETSLPSPPATNGSNQAVPPTPPAKDVPKEEEVSSEEEEEEEKTTVPDEQKVRVEDRDQHKVALRPTEPKPEPKEDKEEEEETEKGKGKEAAEEGGSGSQTPGNSSFQDVAL